MRNKIMFYVFVLIVSVSSFSLAKAPKELKVGMKAPNFKLEDSYGKTYTLSSFKGKMPVIVYFYPKAGTAGCTKEACGIRDDWGKFKKGKIQVLGISVDTKPEIKKFIKDNNLNFPLLSDASTKVSKTYGVYGKGGYDNRVTFIVDKKGTIRKIINVTNIDQHAKEVYDFASKLK
ncbi:MAG TPA: peroxiredoxin [Ignavibacteriaceae bacterium]|nr:peroxiredoxin [Ignavibacteriaceae bacterium]